MRFLLLLVVVSACGGKIVETPPDRDPSGGTPPASTAASPTSPTEPPPAFVEESPPPPAPTPAPAPRTSLDACNALCERDARCDTTIPALPTNEADTGDCDTRCRKRLAGKCGIDDWLFCFAERIDPNACTPLPDECRPAFCAWAKCAKQPVWQCQ
jgi:hypothetical protein